MFKKTFIFIFMALVPYVAMSQYMLSGTVCDASSGQSLVGANVVILNSPYGAVTNDVGYFSIKKLPSGNYPLKISYVGYESYFDTIKLDRNLFLKIKLQTLAHMQEEVIVKSTRVDISVPTTFSELHRKEIRKLNIGRDLPYVLQMSPSVVASSDAGTGIGYTSLRIRGTDMTRINVMVNGIPLNDPESQQVYWVDLPDFASSTDNIQIQRGVGTSVNGAGAFGASINLLSTKISDEPQTIIHASGGSFNTLRNYISFSTGKSSSGFALDGRLSRITSDGYIDRASANLKSFFLSGGYYGKKSLLRINIMGGKEITYQAWEGVPSELLDKWRTFNPAGLYTNEYGDTLYYKNQIDDYQQDHYQLLYSLSPSSNITLNLAAHYTHGFGYYESFREDAKYSKYALPDLIIGNDTIRKTDLINRKHLDNDFAGTTFSFIYEKNPRWRFTLGGAYNYYKGQHFGRIIWARYASASFPENDYYRNEGIKKDFNIYGKASWEMTKYLSWFADMQYRRVDYKIEGIHDDQRRLDQSHLFNFFNPKAGMNISFNERQRLYLSLAVANREPSRDNYRDADEGYTPQPERLYDLELGYEWSDTHLQFGTNFYWMQYKNQLVLTGKINNVGDPIMMNVPDSYRAGIELQGNAQLAPSLHLIANLTLSRNKIKNLTEYVDNWDTGDQQSIYYKETDISFSPPVIAGLSIQYMPLQSLTFMLQSKYVGKQYIDNSSSNERKLHPYFVSDLRIDYSLSIPYIRNMNLFFVVNNIFDHKYESNAWVYSYIYENQRRKMDGYFPQAGIHFIAGLEITL
ncbi:MAG TPA: TonB-dependent receptor [Bacteroidales bacterium]|jgi:iron complex outermembrane receptor protein|nr:TonB-dependent receptor [Bacteroidales bacterium]HNU21413.1 TonB-dependent receptor [Bacteroidales bacterium]HNV16809.1 TonB-dependent receptor [Bacteroidales bacterium]HOH90448.1 TonB-dependent receptor [Bacteroidales bacterium]HOX80417.1 TonB-dependent receptor [Bacteroidales bacterium]